MDRPPGSRSREPRAIALAIAATCTAILGSGCGEPPARVATPAPEPPPPEPIRYDRDIRPILSDRCFRCHGPDPAKRKADLRLDLAESATGTRPTSDGEIRPAAIVPGDPAGSELWRRVTHEDRAERMPPATSGRRPLDEAELALVRRWIEAGARYEPHWSFVAPSRPPMPEVGDPAWCRNPVDRFVLARLERAGIAPSAEADREALCRRVFLDLTGLPPTPEEVDAFLGDARPDAYERLIDRLLDEEPYRTRTAERLAVPWLDAARYADTCGIHTDAGRTIWPWRDWVLAALRDGTPFDRFLTEQIAGDLLPGATQEQRVASGFNRNHVTTDEGGAIAEEYLVEYAVDRAATTGSVFLGLTLGCARCHDHKFDPVSQEEFYRFYAFFDSIDEPGLYSQLPDAKRAFEPFLAVPSESQREELARLDAELESARKELDLPSPGEDAQRAEFLAGLAARAGLRWSQPVPVAAASGGGASLAIQPDGSVLAAGGNPAKDDHVITLRVDGTGLRLIALEALADPSLPDGRVGRAPNGNAVLTGVEVEATSLADPSRVETVKLAWAWADVEQANGDFRVVNALDAGDELGWAVDGHVKEGGRVALFLTEAPFGFEGGAELRVRLSYRSVYGQHTFGRVRLSLGTLSEAGLARLPSASSGWYLVGPFPAATGKEAFEKPFGPEGEPRLDLARNFGFGNQFWRFVEEFADGRLNAGLPEGTVDNYVGRRIFAPTPRKLEASLGSDDGFRLFLDGGEVASREVDRALAADQDRVRLDLPAGSHALVLKVVNSGGLCGFYWKPAPREDELTGDLVAALLPPGARPSDLEARVARAWKDLFSPEYRARRERLAAVEKRRVEIDEAIPRTMVMKELEKPRETFVLMRGAYDRPDKERPAPRGVPAALGRLPEGAPADRLGLARWMTSESNPLVARVAANRVWELVFGTGIVRTSEDFGHQGEWPSHPELLDWLAVDLREGGWSVKNLLRLIATSATYRQSSRARPEVRERDPENRWLAWFPRRRLSAEQIRDQALFAAGLLVEKLGGPSVKPYQPDGLWQEVAMTQSNTRVFERGKGEDLWRRSLYTFWKRACPPPSLMTLDAPTREFCTIRRAATNTPLQALALWNDEQFVEAARALAQRALAGTGDDRSRVREMFRRCAGRAPDEAESAALLAALAGFRERYRAAPEDAKKLLAVGEAARLEGVEPAELASWTMIGGAILNLDAAISRS